jgi:hypothetical protein
MQRLLATKFANRVAMHPRFLSQAQYSPSVIMRNSLQVSYFSDKQPEEDDKSGGGRKVPTGFEKLLKKSRKSQNNPPKT